jgi:hypothetical protein
VLSERVRRSWRRVVGVLMLLVDVVGVVSGVGDSDGDDDGCEHSSCSDDTDDGEVSRSH